MTSLRRQHLIYSIIMQLATYLRNDSLAEVGRMPASNPRPFEEQKWCPPGQAAVSKVLLRLFLHLLALSFHLLSSP
jgi:hypothetical protein